LLARAVTLVVGGPAGVRRGGTVRSEETRPMRNHLAYALAALALVAAGATRADAQGYLGPNQGPTYGPGYRGNISPYLNLLRGQNTGIDYYLGTRSEFQRRADARQFRQDIDDLDRREGEGTFDEGPRREAPVQSGTPATF